jgi:hypothetical protein
MRQAGRQRFGRETGSRPAACRQGLNECRCHRSLGSLVILLYLYTVYCNLSKPFVKACFIASWDDSRILQV